MNAAESRNDQQEDEPHLSAGMRLLSSRHDVEEAFTCSQARTRLIADPEFRKYAAELVTVELGGTQVTHAPLDSLFYRFRSLAQALGPLFPYGSVPAEHRLLRANGLTHAWYRIGLPSVTLMEQSTDIVDFQVKCATRSTGGRWHVSSRLLQLPLVPSGSLVTRARSAFFDGLDAALKRKSGTSASQMTIPAAASGFDRGGKALVNLVGKAWQTDQVLAAVGTSVQDLQEGQDLLVSGSDLTMMEKLPAGLKQIAPIACDIRYDAQIESVDQFIAALRDAEVCPFEKRSLSERSEKSIRDMTHHDVVGLVRTITTLNAAQRTGQMPYPTSEARVNSPRTGRLAR